MKRVVKTLHIPLIQ